MESTCGDGDFQADRPGNPGLCPEAFAAHPQMPLLLNSVGLRRAVLLSFDESVLPTYRATVVSWPSPDGKQVEASRGCPMRQKIPRPGSTGDYLHKTIAQDHWPRLLCFMPQTGPGPGTMIYWSSLASGRFLVNGLCCRAILRDVMAGEYASAGTADDFHGDYLGDAPMHTARSR